MIRYYDKNKKGEKVVSQSCSCTDSNRPLIFHMESDNSAYAPTWTFDGHLLHKECGGLRRVCGGKEASCLSNYCRQRHDPKNQDPFCEHQNPLEGEFLGCSDENCPIEDCCRLRELCQTGALPELCSNIDENFTPLSCREKTTKEEVIQYRKEAKNLRHALAPKLFSFVEHHEKIQKMKLANDSQEMKKALANNQEMKLALAKRFGIAKVECKKCRKVIFRYDPTSKEEKKLVVLIGLIILFFLIFYVTSLFCRKH